MKIKNKFKLNKQALKISSIVAMFAIATIGSVAALAWGPERSTYTIEKPADHVTFNSITNNPNYGDERNFTIARKTSEGSDQWKDTLEVTGDEEYIVRVYVHNNANANLNLVAENVRVKASIPSTTGNKVTLQGQISSSNAKPSEIWDQVVFQSSSRKFNIAYVAGSARYYNNVNPSEGFALSDSITTNGGSLLGYNQMDGKIPGCFQYSGIVTFKVKTQVQKQANFTLNKQVRKAGDKDWQKSIKINPNDDVEYLITYNNTGETTQNNVIIKDKLPNGISYKNNSTKVANASNPNGINISSNEITGKGINIGSYSPGANAYITYSAKVAEAKDLKCGVNKLTNVASASTENGSKENTADVEVNVDCKPDECKPGIPNGDPRCEEPTDKCEVPGKENLEKDDPNCSEGALPTELPKTGPMEAIMIILALTAISAGVAYWYRSREEVKKATMLASGDKTKISPKVNTEEAKKTEVKEVKKDDKK